jgi:dolichol-phosphate mannosyltransferase
VFNVVGALGILVQIGSLWLLVHAGGIQYLAATAVATELAVLHNFAWHRAWTWSDRPTSLPGWLWRLGRFHVANGAVSLCGNVVLMAMLVGWLGIPVLPANLLAIAACSIANFFLGDGFVFSARSSATSRL